MMKNERINTARILCVCCAILLFADTSKAKSPDLSLLRQSLFSTVCRHTDDITYRKKQEKAQKAIDSLLHYGSDEAFAILGNYLCIQQSDGTLKKRILAGLGNIGTPEALQQYNEYELWAKEQTLDDNNFYFGLWNYPVFHFEPHNLKPLATLKEDRIIWAIFVWKRFGSYSLWLTKSLNGVNWDKPLVVNPPQMDSLSELYFRKCKSRINLIGDSQIPFYLNEKTVFKLSRKNGVFCLKINKYKLSFILDDIKQDSDHDGIADDAEKLIFTNPRKADTDEDGIVDGIDSNPLTKNQNINNDTTLIRQAAFYFSQATLNSCDAVILSGDSSAVLQEYYGYRGFILKGTDKKPGYVKLGMHNLKIENENAKVDFSDYVAPMAASGSTIYLKKIFGKWYVVKTGNGWIS